MVKNPIHEHFEDIKKRACVQAEDREANEYAEGFLKRSFELKYSYNFCWLERPIIQYPQDIVGFQEVVSKVRPDVIVETGIAHGGSLVLSASLLCLLDVMEGKDPRQSERKVIGVDIDIRKHNREALEQHPLYFKIRLIEGSSIDSEIVSAVKDCIGDQARVLVSLDSNHTHSHVLAELEAYAPLVSIGSYCIVFDTVVDELKEHMFEDRPWGVDNNPKTATIEWLQTNKHFAVDKLVDSRLLISAAPSGYLKRIG